MGLLSLYEKWRDFIRKVGNERDRYRGTRYNNISFSLYYIYYNHIIIIIILT